MKVASQHLAGRLWLRGAAQGFAKCDTESAARSVDLAADAVMSVSAIVVVIVIVARVVVPVAALIELRRRVIAVASRGRAWGRHADQT